MNRNDLSLAKFQGITCQQCGKRWKPFSQRRGPAPKFCSNRCRQAHYRGTDPDVYKANKSKTCNAPRPISAQAVAHNSSEIKKPVTQPARPGTGEDWQQRTSDLLAECDALLALCRRDREQETGVITA